MTDHAKVPRRCHLFGHRWGYWTGEFWLSVAWCAGGAEDFLVCRRCGIERWEDPNG